VAVRLGEGLHERANLSLRVAGGQFPVLVVAQRLSREHAELTQQLHVSRFELSLLVPATDAQCTALLKPCEERRSGHGAQSGGVKALPDQVGIGAGSGDGDEPARLARRAHHDPGLLEAEHRPRVMRQAIEHDARITQLLGRRHPRR
jgi:hypothetical protein